MKVYELMKQLAELEAGGEVCVDICLTTEELKDGKNISDGTYLKTLYIEEVDECGRIQTKL